MPQSLDQIVIHLIFSTKDRTPWIKPTVRSDLHAYLATVARQFGCTCPRSGGVSDHVHLAIGLARTRTVASLVEELKTTSSKWMKARGDEFSSFGWQRGYAVFSVGPTDLPALTAYIDDQENHHRHKTFQEEYRAFLNKYGVMFDERYLWD